MTLTMPTVEFFFDLSGVGGSGSSDALVSEIGDRLVSETGDALVGSAGGSGFFIVEDPIFGEVESVGIVAGDLATDVTRYVMGVRTTRGRARSLDAIQVGTAEIVLRNDDRRFDPLYTAGPYAGNIRPGKKVRVTDTSGAVYAGHIDDWNFSLDVNGLSVATVTCVDALGDLAAMAMTAWSAASGQTSGERVASVLDRTEVSFPASRSIAAGSATLQGDPIADATNVLQYLQLVSRTELGHLFASKDDILTFQGRNQNANDFGILFADFTGNIRFGQIEISYGTELLYNTTITSRVGGTTITYTDPPSVDEFKTRTLSQTDLLFDSDQQAADLGLFLVAVYGQPELRVASLQTHMGRLTATQREELLGLELGDVATVWFTPDGLGSPIIRDALVEGIEHDIQREDWTTTIRFGDVTSRFVFTVEDPFFGMVEGPGVVAF